METLEKKRAQILKARLDLLNDYLVKEYVEEPSSASFAEYLQNYGISREDFIKDLPPEYQNPPAHGYEELMAYGTALNQLLVNQMLIALEKGELPEQYIADESEQEEGDDEDKQTVLSCDGCSKSNCCSGSKHYNAVGGCPLPPIPPPFPKVKSIKKSVEAWDKYNAKKKAFLDCIKNQKAGGKDIKQHLIHLSNPMEAVGRNAFLDLVKKNVFGMASRFAQMRSFEDKSFYNKGMAKWYNFGGRPEKLDEAINKGKDKKPLFKKKGWKPADGEYLNDGGAAEIAGGIAAAAAIISALVPLIKSFKKAKGEQGGDDEFDSDVKLPVDNGNEGGSGDVAQEGLSGQTKLIIGLAIGIPILGLGIWGIYKLAKN